MTATGRASKAAPGGGLVAWPRPMRTILGGL
jgi:hypothetical protein